MKVAILEQPFDAWQAVASYHRQLIQNSHTGRYPGAATVFVGCMRDFNAGKQVTSMWIEYYPEMTEKYLRDLAQRTLDRYDIDDMLVLHRVGRIEPTDTIVVVAVWSAHRDAAYRANREVMEALKTQAPLWKKESVTDHNQPPQERWVVQ